jgi:hypothetical protein
MFTDWKKMLEEITSTQPKTDEQPNQETQETIIDVTPKPIANPKVPTSPTKLATTKVTKPASKKTSKKKTETLAIDNAIKQLEETKVKKDNFSWNLEIKPEEMTTVTNLDQFIDLWPVTYEPTEDGGNLVKVKGSDKVYKMSKMYTPSFETYIKIVNMLLQKGIQPTFKSFDNLFVVLRFGNVELIDQMHGVCSLTIRIDGQIVQKYRHAPKAMQNCVEYIKGLLEE